MAREVAIIERDRAVRLESYIGDRINPAVQVRGIENTIPPYLRRERGHNDAEDDRRESVHVQF